MKALAELLSALATLAWPVVVGGAIWIFRIQLRDVFSQLAKLLGRLKSWKGLGQEVELNERLDHLEATTAAAVTEVAQMPAAAYQSGKPDSESDVAARVLAEAKASPKLALLVLAREIEREVRRLMAASGWAESRMTNTLDDSLAFLQKSGSLPKALAGSIQAFYDVHRRIVHGGDATTDDILRALDSGLTVLKALRAIPLQVNIVEHPAVEIYADEALTRRLPGNGVILRTTSPGGAMESLRIFPSARTHFERGKRVAWEWNYLRQWDKAWYRDPISGEVKQAWESSIEFIGRHLDEAAANGGSANPNDRK